MKNKDDMKLLYLMGIDWNWIYQRPQIIAKYLETRYNITVIFTRSVMNALEKKRGEYPDQYRILWRIPLQEKKNWIGRISSLLAKMCFRNIEQYDVVVIGYPLYYRYIPENYKGKIIYDCMDNHEALCADSETAEKIKVQEKNLIKRADIVIVTADKLREKVILLGALPEKTVLIRNGTDMSVMAVPRQPKVREKYKIGYFGTIAEWFDYDVLVKSLKKFSDIEYHLIGPVGKNLEEKQEGIVMEGSVEHSRLYEMTKDYDCFVMPFVVNDVVEWVDPVKLYEYIAMGKCIISIKYKEIERFQDYIYMYSNQEEYLQLLEELKQKGFPAKYTANQQSDFLKENFWEKRFEAWDEVLMQIIS